MCADENGQKIEVFETNRFGKAYKRLPEDHQDLVDDQVDLILENPEIGELKKGDLSYLRVHKFYIEKQQYLLGYNWQEDKLVINLLQLGTHENYYDEQKKHRKGDQNFIK